MLKISYVQNSIDNLVDGSDLEPEADQQTHHEYPSVSFVALSLLPQDPRWSLGKTDTAYLTLDKQRWTSYSEGLEVHFPVPCLQSSQPLIPYIDRVRSCKSPFLPQLVSRPFPSVVFLPEARNSCLPISSFDFLASQFAWRPLFPFLYDVDESVPVLYISPCIYTREWSGNLHWLLHYGHVSHQQGEMRRTHQRALDTLPPRTKKKS